MTPSSPWRLEWNITRPEQLEDVIAIVQKAVARKELVPVEPLQSSLSPPGLEVEGLGDPKKWPGIIDLYFRASATDEHFRLVCETDHGAGGSWGKFEFDQDS